MVTERPRQLFRGSVTLLIEDSRSNLLMVQHVPLEILHLPPQEILTAKYISYREIVAMDKNGELYKPLYNRQVIKDWRNHAQRLSLDILSPS